jgi:toxin ParE1/3/4
MKYRVELAPRAGQNLRYIYRNVNAADSVLARDWFNGLQSAILGLGEFPARHPVTPEDSNIRHLLYGSGRYVYRVMFRIDEIESVVNVLHIRHGSRQRFDLE